MQVTFDVRARGSDVNTADEAVVLEWNDRKAKNDGYRASTAGEWTRVHAYVMGSGKSDKLLFRESTTDSDGSGKCPCGLLAWAFLTPDFFPIVSGPFLDNISVVAVTDPFEPSISLSNGVYLDHDDGESCASAGHYAEGAKGTKVTYCFTVTNTGDTYLSNIKLEDKTLDYVNGAVGSLAPGGSVTVSFDAKIGSTMQNEARVTANPADKFGQDIPRLEDVVAHSKDASSVGVGLTTLSPTVTATSSPTISPIMSMDCGVVVYAGDDDNGVGCATANNSIKAMKGKPVTYCISITNTGVTPLTDVKVVDDNLGLQDDTVGTLQPGDSATILHTTTVGDDDQKTDLIATGQPADDSGKALPNKDLVKATTVDSATIEAIKPAPQVSLVAGAYVGDDLGISCNTKAASSVATQAGDQTVFCFQVTNNGNTDLSNVVLSSPQIDFKSNSIGTLAPGDSQEVDFAYTIVSDTADAAVVTITANPTLADGSSMADPVTDTSTVHMVVAGDTRSTDKPSLLTGDGNCIETNWKDAGNTEELLCATRDIFVESGAASKPLQCVTGDKVKVTIDASIRFRDITPRYDVAWYVAKDGGDAMTGTCSSTALSRASNDYSIVDSSGSDQVVGSVVWDATDGDGDECGDVVISSGTDGANLDIPLVVDLEVPCMDDNEDGLLDVAVCFTWRQDCNNDVCSFTAGVIPGNPTTGCYCTRVDISNTEVETPTGDPIVPC